MKYKVDNSLIHYSAEVLVQTETGMTWTQIAKFFRKKSTEHNVPVPYVNTIFPSHLPNRGVGFIQNLSVFTFRQQVLLLRELCEVNRNKNIALLEKQVMHLYQKLY